MDEYMTKSGFPDSSCFFILALDRRHEVAEVDVVIITAATFAEVDVVIINSGRRFSPGVCSPPPTRSPRSMSSSSTANGSSFSMFSAAFSAASRASFSSTALDLAPDFVTSPV